MAQPARAMDMTWQLGPITSAGGFSAHVSLGGYNPPFEQLQNPASARDGHDATAHEHLSPSRGLRQRMSISHLLGGSTPRSRQHRGSTPDDVSSGGSTPRWRQPFTHLHALTNPHCWRHGISPKWTPKRGTSRTPMTSVRHLLMSARDITFSQTLLAAILDWGCDRDNLEHYILLWRLTERKKKATRRESEPALISSNFPLPP